MYFSELSLVFSPLLSGQNGDGLETEERGRAQTYLYACSRARGRVMAARLVHAYVNVLKMFFSRFLIYLYKIHYLIKWSAGIHLIARLYTFIMWVQFTQLSWNWIDPVWKRKTSHDLVSFRRVRLQVALRRIFSVWHQSTARAIRKHRNRLLSYRSRGTLMSYTDHSAQRRLKSNAPFHCWPWVRFPKTTSDHSCFWETHPISGVTWEHWLLVLGVN